MRYWLELKHQVSVLQLMAYQQDTNASAGEELLNAFKVASFATSVDFDDPDYWKKVIPQSVIDNASTKKEEVPLSIILTFNE
jgi:hypothetical protein